MNIREFHVVPQLPGTLTPLLELANDLWWSWNADAQELFRRIAPGKFDELRGNPIRLLGATPPDRLRAIAEDADFREHMDRVLAERQQYRQRDGWFGTPADAPPRIAYFCAEYGIHECLPIYSGGLGVLAGDTLKSASDLGIPMVAVGLAYRNGYFMQRINADGWQTERYVENDFIQMPMTLVRTDSGDPLTVSVAMAERTVRSWVWKVDVGRIPLLLLDPNLPDAPEQDRSLCSSLYGGDTRIRLEQELLLGVGGVHALAALGIQPDLFHMNEGHSALATLEQTARFMEADSLTFEEARTMAAAVNVFTTHTPVAAGHDEFEQDLIGPYLQPFAERMGVSQETLMELGLGNPSFSSNGDGEDTEPEPEQEDEEADVEQPVEPQRFCMTVLGLRMSKFRNAVSKLHGTVSREMWQHLWEPLEARETPIRPITNGIHASTWTSSSVHQLLDSHLEPDWSNRATDPAVWTKVHDIPDQELWSTRSKMRHELVDEIRQRLERQARRFGTSAASVRRTLRVLDPEVLTIGFCRRFATYKRAVLLFRDVERLARIVTDVQRPVQFVFAGKAHPKDEPGKRFIQNIVHLSHEEKFEGRIVFLEGYELDLARSILHGVDVWLNTPRRPYEASGTSGMKAAFNGALNLSILDGWWCEGYSGDNGWAIGEPDADASEEAQDELDAAALYDLLEHEIVPLFYERDRNKLPHAWLERVKNSMGSLCHQFNSDRMVKEYADGFYRPALESRKRLSGNDGEELKALLEWHRHIDENWQDVQITNVDTDLQKARGVGEEIPVSVQVEAPGIDPQDLVVEVLIGTPDAEGHLQDVSVEPTRYTSSDHTGHGFYGTVACQRTGRFGLTVRVRPARSGSDLLWDRTLFHWG